MGKKKKSKGARPGGGGDSRLPFVSICTPTYNRRAFIPALITCYKSQIYPQSRMEWVVVDDGTDPVGDLFAGVEGVMYFRVDQKMKLGRKRNYMHEKSKGEIIVYMDDDDYYPPERVRHAVRRLQSRPLALAVGSSMMYIYFKDLDEIWRFGPYGPMHSTAGTLAFRRELLASTRFNDDAEIAEEKEFLKNYTVPLAQLDSMKSILVFAHDQNTFDKRRLLVNPNPDYVKKTRLRPRQFIKDKILRNFYIRQ